MGRVTWTSRFVNEMIEGPSPCSSIKIDIISLGISKVF